jgi:hypothetical protein
MEEIEHRDEGAEQPKRTMVRRRWAIVSGRGGRAVILASVGAIAIGAPGAVGGVQSAEDDSPDVVAEAADDAD